MTNQEILEKAIQKAIDAGFHMFYIAPFESDYTITSGDDDLFVMIKNKIGEEYTYKAYDFIFNHDFAKALWGEMEKDTWTESKAKGITINDNKPNLSYTVKKEGWQYHLQQMVVAEDPIKYLGDNL